MRKIIFTTILVLFFLGGLLYADDIEYQQRELEKLNRELLEQKQKLDRTKAQEKSTLRDLYYINRQVSRLHRNLNTAQQRLAYTVNSLQAAQQELNQAQLTFSQKQNVFKNRIKEIYKSQGLGYLHLFFSAKSFSDIVNNSYYYGRIIENDIRETNNIRQALNEIQQKRRQLYQKKNEIENMKYTILQEKEVYSSKAKEKQEAYATLRAQRLEYEKRIEELLRNSKEIEKMIQQLMRSRATGAKGTGRFMWPLRGSLTSYYGYRRHPIFKVVKFHTGLDIAARYGTKIVAADSGVVIFTGWWGGYGQTVIIDHGRSYSTVYAHMSKILARNGQTVEKGQTIGQAGSTGYSTGPHLHFEIRIDGRPVDPLKYL